MRHARHEWDGFEFNYNVSLKENFAEIQTRIERACASIDRNPSDVTLIAVTKTVSIEQIQMAYDVGIRHFGESKLQEAIPKIEALPKDIVWHFIGHLQSNKAKRVAQLFPVVQTLSSESQLKEIEKAETAIDGLIEVNIAEEPQKSGVSPVNLAGFLERVLQYEHVRFRGLMTVGPFLDRPEGMRPFFRRMREMNEQFGGQWLSMGMSGDFEVGIQEGATHVRVGSALFGARVYK